MVGDVVDWLVAGKAGEKFFLILFHSRDFLLFMPLSQRAFLGTFVSFLQETEKFLQSFPKKIGELVDKNSLSFYNEIFWAKLESFPGDF